VTTFFFSKSYNKSLEEIEEFIWRSTNNVDLIEKFLDDHDDVLHFISQNPRTASVHTQTGDQSWVFSDGRYRIFFKTVIDKNKTEIYLIHIIDNRQANLKIYPNNSLSTYYEDD